MNTIDLSHYKIKSGAFSIVLIDKTTCKAIKLFKSYDHPSLNGIGKEKQGIEKTNTYRRKVFENEFDAYKRIQESTLLQKFTPTFYGQLKFDKILQGNIDITNQFLSDCCFQLEYINGKEGKLGMIETDEKLLKDFENEYNFNLKVVKGEFSKLGVNFLIDATILINKQTLKIIDFGTQSIYEFEPID